MSKSISTFENITPPDVDDISENTTKTSNMDANEDMDIVSETNPESHIFYTPPSVEQFLENPSNSPTYEYFMYTLTNPNGYRGATSKRPPRMVCKLQNL